MILIQATIVPYEDTQNASSTPILQSPKPPNETNFGCSLLFVLLTLTRRVLWRPHEQKTAFVVPASSLYRSWGLVIQRVRLLPTEVELAIRR